MYEGNATHRVTHWSKYAGYRPFFTEFSVRICTEGAFGVMEWTEPARLAHFLRLVRFRAFAAPTDGVGVFVRFSWAGGGLVSYSPAFLYANLVAGFLRKSLSRTPTGA